MMDNSEISGSRFKLYLTSAIIIFVWGTAYTMVGYAVNFVDPAWVASFRTMLAALVLVAYVFIRGHKFPSLKEEVWLWYIALGFLGMAVPFYLIARGQVHVESGLTGILAGFMPLITIVLAHFLVAGERLSFRKFIGFLLGFVGIVILFMPDIDNLELVNNWRSQALIIIAAGCYASATIIAKRAPYIKPSVGAAMMAIAGAILSFIFALFSGIPDTVPPASAILAIFGLAVGSTGIANILFLRLIQETGPSFVARINYLVPICALVAGMIFLSEPFQWRSVIALIVVIAGLVVAGSAHKAPIASPSTRRTD
ncbi:MAG: DMT family transporter [Acidimicrobiales bacterium]|nr:DMT family transporter [Hyphomonadaceae bacterium]RZV43667.1 MAG: DMT family transporter [Acidimicrobiales bacterium]